VQQREDSITQLIPGLQMATRDTMRPRTSIVEANRTLGTKPRDPLEDRLRADSEFPSHRCGHLAIHDSGNNKRPAVRASLSISVQLHDRCPFERRWPRTSAIRLAWPRKSSGYARSAVGPVPRQKLMDALRRVIRQAGEHVGEPGVRTREARLVFPSRAISCGALECSRHSLRTPPPAADRDGQRATPRRAACVPGRTACSDR
jgi:hypothetical protein